MNNLDKVLEKKDLTFDDIFEISRTAEGRKLIQDTLKERIKEESIKTNTPIVYVDSSKPGECIYEYSNGTICKI